MTQRTTQAAEADAGTPDTGSAISMGELRENWRAVRGWLRSDAAPGWILFGILIVGALLRLTNLNWDDFTHIHPDERFLTMVTAAISLAVLVTGIVFFRSTEKPMA